MAELVVVSFRLGGTDGVSIEAGKWIHALGSLGHHVRTLAGEGVADSLVPGLAIRATNGPTFDELAAVLDGADLTIVENVASLPLNVAARDALYDVLHGRRALFRHHDLAWQRLASADIAAPRDEDGWRHVTINELSRRELRERGVDATLVRNTFDCAPPLGRRELTRRAVDVSARRVVLFPSRAIARKNVGAAFDLATSLDAVLWLLGPAEDGYDEALDELIAASATRVVVGMPDGFDIHDAYAACDLVVVPSTWEGFGNPVLESVTHRRPLAVYPYPVLEEIRAFGFRFFGLEDVSSLAAFLDVPDEELLGANLAVAREHFNVDDLPQRLAPLLGAVGAN
ncbi:MAG: glycosyltransferase [Acidimicrobiales bacterium]